MMRIVLLFISFPLFTGSYGQSPAFPDSGRNYMAAKSNWIRSSSDSAMNPKTLDGILLKKFPENSSLDGRWVYYPKTANTQKIDKLEVAKIIPGYNFYKISLTNFLGYHINSSNNLILFDSAHSKVIQVVPMWYGDISEEFLKMFIGKKFLDSTSLLLFTRELQDLMKVGSTGKFENTKYQSNKVTFDNTYEGARGTEVWRHIEMFIADNTIKRFRSTNPKMNESITVQ